MEESRRGEETGKKESNALENRGQRSLQQTQSLPQLQPGGTTQTDRWARDIIFLYFKKLCLIFLTYCNNNFFSILYLE